MKLEEMLRDLRQKANLTQAEASEQSQTAIGSLRNWEQGLRQPDWRALFRLAKLYGVDVSVFYGCLDAPAKKPRSKRGRPRKDA